MAVEISDIQGKDTPRNRNSLYSGNEAELSKIIDWVLDRRYTSSSDNDVPHIQSSLRMKLRLVRSR
jgi:hypothetical protein